MALRNNNLTTHIKGRKKGIFLALLFIVSSCTTSWKSPGEELFLAGFYMSLGTRSAEISYLKCIGQTPSRVKDVDLIFHAKFLVTKEKTTMEQFRVSKSKLEVDEKCLKSSIKLAQKEFVDKIDFKSLKINIPKERILYSIDHTWGGSNFHLYGPSNKLEGHHIDSNIDIKHKTKKNVPAMSMYCEKNSDCKKVIGLCGNIKAARKKFSQIMQDEIDKMSSVTNCLQIVPNDPRVKVKCHENRCEVTK